MYMADIAEVAYATYDDKEPVISRVEADAIVAVMRTIFPKIGKIPEKGTFILKYQAKNSRRADSMIYFNFKNGPSSDYRGSKNSVSEANSILDAAADTNYRRHSTDNSKVDTLGSQSYLNLAAQDGKFLCACCGDRIYNDDQTVIYCAVAQALSMLKDSDSVMQKGVAEVNANARDFRVRDIEQAVKDLFNKNGLPEIQAWKDNK